MALGGGYRLGEVLPDEGTGEAGTCGKEGVVDGGCPGVDDGAPCTKVEPCGKVNLGAHVVHVVYEGRSG